MLSKEKTEVKKIIKGFAEILKNNRIAFTQIWLFGSYATGRTHKWSDIDVAVVASKLPRGRKYLDKKMKLWVLAAKADNRIEPILLEESDLNEKTASIMGCEVKKHGILVVSE